MGSSPEGGAKILSSLAAISTQKGYRTESEHPFHFAGRDTYKPKVPRPSRTVPLQSPETQRQPQRMAGGLGVEPRPSGQWKPAPLQTDVWIIIGALYVVEDKRTGRTPTNA